MKSSHLSSTDYNAIYYKNQVKELPTYLLIRIANSRGTANNLIDMELEQRYQSIQEELESIDQAQHQTI